MAQLCQFKTVANRLWPCTCVQAPLHTPHLPTSHCRIPPPHLPLQNIITHQLLHLNSTDEDTNKTDGMFLCMTRNGEMYTIGTLHVSFEELSNLGMICRNDHTLMSFSTRVSLGIMIYFKGTCESMKKGQNDISYIACFQFTRTARCSQCFWSLTL